MGKRGTSARRAAATDVGASRPSARAKGASIDAGPSRTSARAKGASIDAGASRASARAKGASIDAGPSLRAAPDADAYRDDPVGSSLALTRALVFCARPTLWGFALWGAPTEADLARIVPLLRLELARGAPPHASLIDARRLESSDPRAFAVLSTYLRANFDAFRTQVTRLALVRPPGVLGATVAGFYQVAGAPYPVRVFDDLPAACTWLRAPELATQLDAAIADASQISPVILQLRRWLESHLDDASLARAAKAVSRAPRSLQRDLTEAGTSFQAETDAARIRLAKRLLVETSSSLTEIAYDVGCASPQHFSTLFRRVTEMTPSRFRSSETSRREPDRDPRGARRTRLRRRVP